MSKFCPICTACGRFVSKIGDHKCTGGTSWNKGLKCPQSPEHLKKRIAALPRGEKHWQYGKHPTPEMHEKNRLAHLGKPVSKETRLKISAANLGKKRSDEARRNLSLGQKGEKGSNWQGGIYPMHKLIRTTAEYKEWRRQVFKRDRYTCVLCKASGVTIQADHIKSFSSYPELRFDLSNGRTLCLPCHRNTETWGSHKKHHA